MEKEREEVLEKNPLIDKGQLGKVLEVLAELKKLGIETTTAIPTAPYQETIYKKIKRS